MYEVFTTTPLTVHAFSAFIGTGHLATQTCNERHGPEHYDGPKSRMASHMTEATISAHFTDLPTAVASPSSTLMVYSIFNGTGLC